MKKLSWFILLLLSFGASAQTKEEVEIKNVITTLFNKMQQGDSAAIWPLFHKEARLQTTELNGKTGTGELETEPLGSFLTKIAAIRTRNVKIEERMMSSDIKVDLPLAQAWVEYEFYINNRISHKGVDAFQFIKTAEGWKIIQLCDTRKKK